MDSVNEDLSVVLVSNRGPISFVEGASGYETKRGAGGLAGAVDPVARRLGDNAVWIAAATSEADRKAVASGAADGVDSQLGYSFYLLDIDPEIYSKYYDVVSNRMLWFANHCLWDEVDVKPFDDQELDAWTSAYEPVNRRFAEVAAEVADRDAFVLFQDYHLATAPAHLRRLRPKQTIFHFTHSSFCGPRGLQRLPEQVASAVVQGMLGADLIGFHVPAWAHGFLSACEELGAEVDRARGHVDHDGVESWVRTYPIPIDAEELRSRLRGTAAREWVERFKQTAPGPILVRADRMEPSKNIVRGFEAFGLFKEQHPDVAADVRFIACLYPSRQSMPEYRDYAQRAVDAAAAVNERFPGSIELFAEDDFDRTLGALAVYDVLLVNPLMDGMNLVSKEGPALNERSGALVLSSGAGSFEELGEDSIAISDPGDVQATADALHAAFTIDSERRRALARRLKKKATERKPDDWINSQLDDLIAIRERGEPMSALKPPRR
jgi:trehalose 6-phosphate synthase